MKKIDSIQGLRALAFFLVFFSHCGIFKTGQLGVSIFLVLSGMLMIIKHYNEDALPTIKKSLNLAINHVKKLYPLHILTTIMSLPFLFKHATEYGKGLEYIVKCIIANVFLLHSWFPNVEIRYSLNNLSWFLCVSVFCYFCFLYLKQYIIVPLKTIENCKVCIFLIIALQFVYGLIINYLFNDIEIIKGLIYNFPLSRILDFIIGMALGKTYLLQEGKNNKKVNNYFYDIFAVISIFLVQLLIELSADQSYWWSYVVILSFPVIFLITRVVSSGLLTNLCSLPILIRIGDKSANLYLIHEIVIRYLRIIIRHSIFKDLNVFTTKLVLAIVALVISEMLNVLWNNRIKPLLQPGKY